MAASSGLSGANDRTATAVQGQASVAQRSPTSSGRDLLAGQPRATTAQMTLARPAALPSAQPVAVGAAPTVARSVTSGVPGPTFQASPAAAPAATAGPAFGPTATAVVQRIDGNPPPVTQPRSAAKRSDDELDELAGALFGRFRNRLRNEYIYEREAKGLTFDQS
jgi:hypothetical protein